MDQEIITKLKIDSLGSPFYGCEITTSHLLQGNQMVIKSGNKLFVCPDFTLPENELKYIDVGDPEDIVNEMKKEDDFSFFNYESNPIMVYCKFYHII